MSGTSPQVQEEQELPGGNNPVTGISPGTIPCHGASGMFHETFSTGRPGISPDTMSLSPLQATASCRWVGI